MTQTGLAELIADKRMKPVDLKVILHLVSIVTWGNQAKLNRKSAIELCEISESELCRSLKRLRNNGYLLLDHDDSNLYTVRPDLVWRGKPEHQYAALVAFNTHFGPDKTSGPVGTCYSKERGRGKCSCGSTAIFWGPGDEDEWISEHAACPYQVVDDA